MTGRARLVFILGLGLLMTSCASTGARPAATDPDVGLTVFSRTQPHSLPHVTGTTLTGRSLDVSSYAAGSTLVINVWASWCSPCRRELPLLARTARHGIRVLGIDERDSAHRALSFAAGNGATYPSLSDPEGRVLTSLDVLPQTGIPSTLVVAPDGSIVARVVGPLTAVALHRALREAAS